MSRRPADLSERETAGDGTAGQAAAEKVGELTVFGTALMFLTRLPVGSSCSSDPAILARSTRWFPLIGLLIGCLLSLIWLVVLSVLPASLAVLATLVAGVLLTGAFHEDGLADLADSAGAFGVDDKLAIMRDSRVGTYGALALILLMLARFIVLWELSVAGVAVVSIALISAHVLARWSSVWLMARIPYARAEAANRVVAQDVDRRRLIEASLVALAALTPVLIASVWQTLLCLIVALLVTIAAGHRFRRTLGGITGDCLGACNVLVEIAVLITILLLTRS